MWFCLLWTLSAFAPSFLFAEEPVRTHVRVIPEVTSISPGVSFDVATSFNIDADWHIYWQNPGESGLPTEVTWSLPADWSVSPLAYPFPHRIVAPPVVSYGYDGEVWLLSSITPPADLQLGQEVTLQADIRWMECADICIPRDTIISLTLPVRQVPQLADADTIKQFSEARLQIPITNSEWKFSAQRDSQFIDIDVLPSAWEEDDLSEVTFFPLQRGWLDPTEPTSLMAVEKKWIVRGLLSESSPPDQLKGVLVSDQGWRGAGSERAVFVDIPIEVVPHLPTRGAGKNILIFFLLAFAGGILLNIMPCVFPVLSLKILGFVEAAHGERRQLVLQGVGFTAGVVVSFWFLAGVLLWLKNLGQELGWGFHLQAPSFVWVLIVLFFVLGLALFGVFEIGVFLTRLGGSSQSRHGLWGAFFSGVLATIIATPCTAPFMGPAVGFALTQPVFLAMGVFTFLGLGMAAPYLLLSLFPQFLRFLPKPGAWMESFKQAMGFLMMGTVVWLLGVLGQQEGVDAVMAAVAGCVSVALGVWVWGRWGVIHASLRVRLLAGVATFFFIFIGMLIGFRGLKGNTVSTSDIENRWEPYSQARVDSILAEGRGVFIDFTAAWCLSCQVNKKVVLDRPSTTILFEQANVIPLRGDWTDRDPDITRALNQHGRSSVPLYLFYPPGVKTPQVLPAVLTPGIMKKYLLPEKMEDIS